MLFWRLISVGPKYGLLCINGNVKDGPEAIKAKRDSLELEHQIFKGSTAAVKNSKGYVSGLERKVCYANCCCCSTYSSKHAPPKRKPVE